MKRYEIFDHTVDTGLIVYGETLASLFENAGEGFFNLITDLKRVRPHVERRIELGGEPLARLMVDWLAELLFLHDVDLLLFREFSVESVGQDGLRAVVRGERFDEERCVLLRAFALRHWCRLSERYFPKT